MLAKEPLRHDHWARVRRARIEAIEHKLWENDISRWLSEGGRDLSPIPYRYQRAKQHRSRSETRSRG
jgi:hypothetical protein